MSSLFSSAGKLHGPNGSDVDVASLAGKTLGIYFSAHWCPPCRGFTPKLVEWLGNFKQHAAHAADFDVVFVSSDRDEKSFNEYFAEMKGFHALHYSERALKDSLSSKFGVSGIPTFIIVDAAGQVINKNGRAIVANDATGAGFPWKQPTAREALQAATFIDNKGGSFSFAERLAGKYVGLYFSASWCPPCRAFSPKLGATYEKVVAAGKPFECVFVSADRAEADFHSYHGHLPFLALPFDDKKTKDVLDDAYDVEGIPTLVILDPEGKMLTDEGVGSVAADPEGAQFPWPPATIMPVSGNTLGAVNKGAVVLALGSGSEAAAAAARGVFEAVLAQHPEYAGEYKFMYADDAADDDDDALQSIRNFAGLSAKHTLVLLNIPKQHKVLAADDTPITADTVLEFLTAYSGGALDKKPIRG